MNELFSLKDKVIVVTGGTGVLGKSFVKGIVAADGTVAIIGRDINKANILVEEIVNKGGKALAISADVLSESELVVAREKILSAFGKIDGLVNAAGGNILEGVLQNSADIFDLNIQGMKNALELNVWGTLIPTQIFGSVMVKNGGGSIVNISSVSPKRALTKVWGYSMGKAAVDAYIQWFAVETANRFGDTIRMNALMPGFFLTEQNKTLLTN
jgi:NAD(P)-dependent dehydrogenase (short-subunit alcohol dehydrogenase family)